MELGTYIRKIPDIRGANVYVVLDMIEGKNGGLTLIDTGMPGNASRIIDFLRSLDKREQQDWLPSNLTIILTHSDIDHSGSASELKNIVKDSKIAIHEADAPRLSGEKELKKVKSAMGILFKIMGGFMKFHPVKPDIVLRGGEVINGLTVIHTPGHTDGSISLYSKTLKAIFVGDALRTDKNGNLKRASSAMTLNMDEANNSIRHISSYDFELLLPGHGAPILKEASKKVKEFIASWS
jgi:hydroxyacylglutathione hydrolase